MNPRERVLTALRREQPDRVPFQLSLTPPLYDLFCQKTGATHVAEYWDFDLRSVHFNLQAVTLGANYDRYYPDKLPPGTKVNAWGIAEAPGSMHHFVRMIHPLRSATTVDDIADYPLPTLSDSASWQHLERQVADFHARERAVLGALEMTVFEISWYLRGMVSLTF